MNYYLLKLTDTLPNGFGGTSFGPLIRLLPKYARDAGLLEHEKTHVRQWYAAAAIGLALVVALAALTSLGALVLSCLAVSAHGLLYRFFRPYRRWSEVQAYRKQIEVGGYTSIEFAVTHLVQKYDLGLSSQDAAMLLAS